MADTNTDEIQKFAVDALDKMAGMDRLLDPDAAGGERVGFADLYAYAVDPTHEPAADVLAALDQDAGLQADFQRLLRNTARYYMPEVAAASTGELESREADGCRLVFRPSRADENQLYVIVEATADASFEPEILFVQFADGRSRRMPLGGGQKGRAQVLVERDSEIAQGLLDISTEVFVK